MIIQTSAPSLTFIYYYILLGEGGWTYNEYNTLILVTMCLCSLFLMLIASEAKKMKFWKIVLLSSIVLNFANCGLSIALFASDFSVPIFIVIYGIIYFLNVSGLSMVFVPVVGRISKYLPDGFESTGVTLVVAANKLSFFICTMSTSYLLSTYQVDDGYYGRLKTPQLISDWIYAASILIAPLFLWVG